MKFNIVNRLVTLLLSFMGALLVFFGLSIFFVLIKSGQSKVDFLEVLPPHYTAYYILFVALSIVAGYLTMRFIVYFTKNFGDVENMPNSRNASAILGKTYKSQFLNWYMRIAIVLYALFLTVGFLFRFDFLLRFVESKFGEDVYTVYSSGAFIVIVGSIPVAYFLSRRKAEIGQK